MAVKTTGIFCRPVCPATPPKEANVVYFDNAARALQAGFRPCLRCRPDSAPGSFAWQGAHTTFARAVRLIDEGCLQRHSLSRLAERLGISDRYLRDLFERHLGMSPKQYSQYQQVMFAKQLLHDSSLPIADIAFAAGFNSLRRFNDCFKKLLSLSPTQVRNQHKTTDNGIELTLSVRPPFNWQYLLDFYRRRGLDGVEHITQESYSRSFQLHLSEDMTKSAAVGVFHIRSTSNDGRLRLRISLSDVRHLQAVVLRIRRVFDLDTDIAAVASHLSVAGLDVNNAAGLRLPGVWHLFEAGVRAVLGQQVSVAAARTQVQRLVQALGEPVPASLQLDGIHQFFPTPNAVAAADLSFLKLPDSRRDTLRRLAQLFVERPVQALDVERWQDLKGIGPWTVNYVRLRGLQQPDVFLDGDLVIKKQLQQLGVERTENSAEAFSPWGSYATLMLWQRAALQIRKTDC